MKKIFLLIALVSLNGTVSAETIKLKNGKTIEGKIVEQKSDSIKVDSGIGISISYFLDELESINGKSIEKSSQPVPKVQNAVDVSKLLEIRGYPKQFWFEIGEELNVFFGLIDLPRLSARAQLAKKSDLDLRNFIADIGREMNRLGYNNYNPPHRLIKQLVNGFGYEDMEKVIDVGSMSWEAKNKERMGIFSCSALTQLGSIVLDILNIESKSAIGTEHTFNVVPLDNEKMLFVDFANEVFEIVDIGEFYKMEGEYWVLRDVYRYNILKRIELLRRWGTENQKPETLQDILNALYFYVQITNNSFSTAAIFSNRGVAYDHYGDSKQALASYNTSLELNPNNAEVYSHRGILYFMQGELDQALIDLNKASELNPNYNESFYNRGKIYLEMGNYNQAITDLDKSIELYPDADAYVNLGVAYDKVGDFNQAIVGYSKAIELNPGNVNAYYNRGIIKYQKLGNIDDSCLDFRMACELGDCSNYNILKQNGDCN